MTREQSIVRVESSRVAENVEEQATDDHRRGVADPLVTPRRDESSVISERLVVAEPEDDRAVGRWLAPVTKPDALASLHAWTYGLGAFEHE